MSEGGDIQTRQIYEQWHDAIKDGDLERLMALYREDAIMETPLALVALKDRSKGILEGKDEIRSFFKAGLRNLGSELNRWYRTGLLFSNGQQLIWEYPRETPKGDQVDLVEVMDISEGRIHHHRVYWGWLGFQVLTDTSRTRRNNTNRGSTVTGTIIAHLTDMHLGQKLVMGGEVEGDKMRYGSEPEQHKRRLQVVLENISEKGISDVVLGGDIGSKASVPRLFEALSGYDFNVSVCLENQDGYKHVAPYRDAVPYGVKGKMCWSRADEHMKYIYVDSSDNSIGDDQLAWIQREIQAAKKVVLFLHHPILPVDTPVERAGVALRDRDEIKALLTGASCEVSVFCGHYHMIDETSEANIRQFISPAVSYQIIKNADNISVDADTFGYRVVEFLEDRIATEAILFTGESR